MVNESPDKVSMRTVEKLTLENMDIVFGGGTEPEIHLGGGSFTQPQLQLTFKKYHCNTTADGVLDPVKPVL